MEDGLLIAIGKAGIWEAKAIKAQIIHYTDQFCTAVQNYPASMQRLETELLDHGAMYDESQGRRL
jgi:hypothetical protein